LKSFLPVAAFAIVFCVCFIAPLPGHTTLPVPNPTTAIETRTVIIDTDPGTDDAMAILLALNSPELNVKAITVVPGNAPGKQVLENGLRLVSLANRCDIPVAAGALEPLFQKLIANDAVHGKNGLGDIELPPSKCHVDPRFGPDLIIEMAHQMPHEITLIAMGPLTNLALALQKDPSISSLI
jgi:inosine-uridine nucleoside N-ribohydrolase